MNVSTYMGWFLIFLVYQKEDQIGHFNSFLVRDDDHNRSFFFIRLIEVMLKLLLVFGVLGKCYKPHTHKSV